MTPAPSSGIPCEEFGVQDSALIDAARMVVRDGVGQTVRAVPHRRTLRYELGDGRRVFCKLRDRRPGDARLEWRWLGELPRLGFRAPQPVLLAHRGNHTAVCTLEVPGRPVQALIAEAMEAGQRAVVIAYAGGAVAPLVRRFHGEGLVFRDLYWNHLYAESLDEPFCEPAFIDVERIFRPRWRWRRWQVKDLAGLLASLPLSAPPSILLRALHTYLGGREKPWRPLARAVITKAARIRRHRPRWSGEVG